MSKQAYPAGTLSLLDIQKTIYDAVKTRVNGLVPGAQVIWRNQSAPLPPRPCVTMRITSGPTRVGFQDNQVFVGGATGTQFNVWGHRTMVVSFQIFGSKKVKKPQAFQLAIDLNSSLSLPTVLQTLSAGGVSVQGQGSPLNITALEESEWEERAQFDVTFGLAQNVIDDPGIIEIVESVSGVVSTHTQSIGPIKQS